MRKPADKRAQGETVASVTVDGVTAWANGFGIFLDLEIDPEAIRRARKDGPVKLAQAIMKALNAVHYEGIYRHVQYEVQRADAEHRAWQDEWNSRERHKYSEGEESPPEARYREHRVTDRNLAYAAEEDFGAGLWTAGLRELLEGREDKFAELSRRTAFSEEQISDLVDGRYFPMYDLGPVFGALAEALGLSIGDLLKAGAKRLARLEPPTEEELLEEENIGFDVRRDLDHGWYESRILRFLLIEVPLGEIVSRRVLPEMLREPWEIFPTIGGKGELIITTPLELAQEDHQSLGRLSDPERRCYLANIQSQEWRKLVRLDKAAARGDVLSAEDRSWLVDLLGDPAWCARTYRGREDSGSEEE
ncbi:MAG: helix-turn-helix domain-containing protein [bacterium]|nr:helix-turn-helix domain-containing protein [bacterium]